MSHSRRLPPVPLVSLATPIATSLALLSLAAAPLQAQRCLGFPSFAGRPLRLDGTLTGGGRTTLGADLAFGQAAGVFGSVGIGVADYDNVDDSAVLGSGTIGTQVQLGTASRTSEGVQLCPVGGIEYRSGPNAGNVDQSGLVLRGGVSLGTSIPMTPTVRFAPFGTLSAAYARATIDAPRASATTDEVGGIIDLGTGFVFTNRFTIRPSVSIPVGFDGEDARLGLAVGFNFGGGR